MITSRRGFAADLFWAPRTAKAGARMTPPWLFLSVFTVAVRNVSEEGYVLTFQLEVGKDPEKIASKKGVAAAAPVAP